MSRPYLYIAQERRFQGTDQYKVGFSARLEKRAGGLRGEADTDFDLLKSFPTADGRLAETLAFTVIDSLGVRLYPGTRRESVMAPLELLQGICVQAAGLATRRTPPGSRHGAPPPRFSCGVIRHRSLMWKVALEMPTVFSGQRLTLGQLMSLAMKHPAAARRLSKLGIERISCDADKPDFQFRWDEPGLPVVKWLALRDCRAPSESVTATRFTHLPHAAP